MHYGPSAQIMFEHVWNCAPGRPFFLHFWLHSNAETTVNVSAL